MFDLGDNKKSLHSWIMRSLEPIYSADRVALADYILALIENANGTSLSRIPKAFFVR